MNNGSYSYDSSGDRIYDDNSVEFSGNPGSYDSSGQVADGYYSDPSQIDPRKGGMVRNAGTNTGYFVQPQTGGGGPRGGGGGGARTASSGSGYMGGGGLDFGATSGNPFDFGSPGGSSLGGGASTGAQSFSGGIADLSKYIPNPGGDPLTTPESKQDYQRYYQAQYGGQLLQSDLKLREIAAQNGMSLQQLKMQLAFQAWQQQQQQAMQMTMQQKQLDQTNALTRGGWDNDAFMQADADYRKWGIS